MIETVCGPIDARDVRNTLAHEHLTFGEPGFEGEEPNCYRRDEALSNCLRHFARIEGYDVNLVVDCTPIEHGRDPRLMQQLCRATGVDVVCATGFFKDEGQTLALLRSASYTRDLVAWMTELFVSELADGIGTTGARAGVIKVASSLGEVRPLEREVMRAAAAASVETGAPVTTHCDRGTMAAEQLRILVGAGATPERVVIGHQTSNRDLGEVCAIMDQGATVGFDQFGIESIPGIPTDAEKCENLLELVRRGYEDRIVLSNDCPCDRMGYVSSSAPRSLDNCYRDAVPYLREHGVSDESIRKLTRDNLVRLLDV